MRLNKTERESLRKRAEIVIPQISKLEIFNLKASDEELSMISSYESDAILRDNQEQKENGPPDLLDTYQ